MDEGRVNVRAGLQVLNVDERQADQLDLKGVLCDFVLVSRNLLCV